MLHHRHRLYVIIKLVAYIAPHGGNAPDIQQCLPVAGNFGHLNKAEEGPTALWLRLSPPSKLTLEVVRPSAQYLSEYRPEIVSSGKGVSVALVSILVNQILHAIPPRMHNVHLGYTTVITGIKQRLLLKILGRKEDPFVHSGRKIFIAPPVP